MGRFKLTSPGVLLILAITAAGGIFLLDVFGLQPRVEAQKSSALREQAVKAEEAGRQAMRNEETSLLRLCAALSSKEEFADLFDRKRLVAEKTAWTEGFQSLKVDLAWLCDAEGDVIDLWSVAPTAGDAQRQELTSAMKRTSLDRKQSQGGLIELPGGAAVFAARSVWDKSGQPRRVGAIGVACNLSASGIGDSAAVGGDVTFIPAAKLPPGTAADHVTNHAYWFSDDRVNVAWLAHDFTGKTIGYFLANLPVNQVQRQAAAARRMVLAILSLSAGLVVLTILGVHMLVTGPVVRLLRRLQRLDAGQDEGDKGLTRDLHGEPLMLARRLESAFAKLSHISKTDHLTGLANRRHFQEVTNCFYHQARRYNRPLSVIVMDVDYFKAVNDTCGHQGGDELLKLVASAIERSCRQTDLPARMGGDEFAVLLPETAADDAGMVAQRIRQNIGETVASIKGVQVNATVSVGLTDLNAGEIDSPDAMFALADKALYAAKELGRNRMVQAHDLNGLSLSGAAGESDAAAQALCAKLAGLNVQFKDLFVKAIEEVMGVLEQRAPYMADHARKVQHYATLIGNEMELPDRVLKRLQIASMLHDIGMVAMPDSVLLNPGKLDERQLATMRKHPLLSVRIMEGMEFLEQEIPAVRYHHERFDGKGYPEGISGPTIPLTARILAVADAFDAMTSPRAFRAAKSIAEAMDELNRDAGSQFDPVVVEALLSAARKLGDKLTDMSTSGPTDLEEMGRQAAADQAAEPTADKPARQSSLWRDTPAKVE